MRYLIPLKGKPQNITDINSAMESINNCYYSKGYILSKVDSVFDDPDGMLNLNITEGKINKVMITGNEKTKEYVIERNIMTNPELFIMKTLLNKIWSDFIQRKPSKM